MIPDGSPTRTSTVEQRRAKQEYDKRHPWQPITTAQPGPAVCELQFADGMGDVFDGGRSRYFFDEETLRWYQINPPAELFRPRPIGWRLTNSSLMFRRRESIKKQARTGRA